ncbi:MAG TPA: aminotransferase, partial [Chryseolinea sp.]|nr:aminotransferase [Chryseolinea sp.]
GLIQPLLRYLRENGYWIEQDEYRANHLFGFRLPAASDKQNLLLLELQRKKIFVSVRGEIIRVSPHVYNDENDITALIEALEKNNP